MESLQRKLIECGQEHLLKFYDELSDKEKEELCQDISELNFMDVISYFDSAIYASLNISTLDDKVSPIPKENIASVKTTDKEQLKMYEELGFQEIANGQVAVLLMAGGQGTRLGVTYPKGIYNVGLPSGKTLFQLQAERILRLENMAKEKYGKDGEITWYILTSEATHDITISFLQQHNYFNLKEKNCKAFKQGMLPCFTLDGKIILDKKYKISKAPDGNGGVYQALITQGILDDMIKRGIHSVHVHSVDNILIKVADPIFIGYCLSLQTDCGVKVIEKCSPNEPVGIVCKVNDIFKVVEYSEISKETAELYSNDGQLMYNAANICNHYFTVDFLYSIAKYHEKEMELHAAKKKIPYIDEDGNRNEPKIPNDNCHLNNDKCEETTTNMIEINCIQNLKKEINKLFANIRCNLGSVEYTNLNKMLANCYLKTGNELEAIFHLIESHAVILRQQILHRCIKTEMRKLILNVQQTYGLKSSYVGFNINNKNKIENIKTILFDLPKEWYMIQITGQYKSSDIFTYTRNKSDTMHEIYITVLPTGIKEVEPLCLALPKPKLHSSYDICYEIQKLLSNNRSELETTYANNELYWKMRERQNENMKTAMHALEHIWLREWRILFMADPINKQNLVTDIVQMIDKLISDHKTSKVISKRSTWLLKKIALAACFLTKEEIARAVKYVLSDYDKLADSVILSIFGKLSCMQELKNATRKTLVLIIDEHMDYIPFESMEILKFHPITRFPSLHIAYALFKEHEDTIENGCKIIRVKDDMGTCIVNPSGNLSKMEKRMRLFIEYWLPNWRSWYNIEPQEEVFEDSLINRDILMYNGHGNGIQYLPGEQIERLRVKSIVLLFGCSSVKLLNVGGRYPPYGISNQYLIASSPCVLGMLWEVTDADTDKMTTNFISNWIPSPLNRPWTDVDINMWCLGILKFLKNSHKSSQNLSIEPEMLRAVAKSKDVCSHYMTAAAIIVRGLPIKLI